MSQHTRRTPTVAEVENAILRKRQFLGQLRQRIIEEQQKLDQLEGLRLDLLDQRSSSDFEGFSRKVGQKLDQFGDFLFGDDEKSYEETYERPIKPAQRVKPVVVPQKAPVDDPYLKKTPAPASTQQKKPGITKAIPSLLGGGSNSQQASAPPKQQQQQQQQQIPPPTEESDILGLEKVSATSNQHHQRHQRQQHQQQQQQQHQQQHSKSSDITSLEADLLAPNPDESLI